jgi:hypothetical protein
MNFFAEITLPLAERGFSCFPLVPKSKRPLSIKGDADHFDASTTDPEQINSWAFQEPNANVGLAPDEIFCFLETDDDTALHEACSDISPAVWDTTRVSARVNRCYYIFRQTARTRKVGNMTKTREGKENLFELKIHRAYVTGPGSIHPKTNAPYAVEWRRIPAMPDVLLNRLCELYGKPKASESQSMSAETVRQTELLDRFLATYEVATTGDWFNKGKQWYRPIECPWLADHDNDNQGTSTCIVYTEGGGYGFDCKHRCSEKDWKEFRAELERRHSDRNFSFVTGTEPVGDVAIGSAVAAPEPPNPLADWRTLFHSREAMLNAPPITFLIKDYLMKEGVTAIAAPVRERKSLIAINIVHALLTGEKLFDHFEVVEKPSRVLYLCPEVSLGPFTDRIKKIGLMDFVGGTLFCRTLSADGHLELNAPELQPALPGSVVILDTAIRFLKGDENSSSDVRAFADSIFALLKGGAESVVMLHHSPKDAGDSMTLESAMRGSGDMGAFLACCWGTRLQDPAEPYKSTSFLSNLKMRDFESKDFEVTCGPDCRMHIVGDPALGVATLAPRRRGNVANKDGKDGVAIALIKANPKLSVRKAVELLKDSGIKRGKDWVQTKRYELMQKNGGQMP